MSGSILFRKRLLLKRARELGAWSPDRPLFGIPFAVKDNIDVEGLPTTAGCPAFSYVPQRTASAVQKAVDAGAILIGKTNMDQFATGLVGTRSPYGACSSIYHAGYISGGSSSGSALAVAKGEVCFALGTDTAGSGRIPAAFNGIVGVKPTRGLVSTAGVVPACRSLDCVSVFSPDVETGARVLEVLAGVDEGDPYSRSGQQRCDRFTIPKIGIPGERQMQFFGDEAAADCWRRAVLQARGLAERVDGNRLDSVSASGRTALLGPVRGGALRLRWLFCGLEARRAIWIRPCARLSSAPRNTRPWMCSMPNTNCKISEAR